MRSLVPLLFAAACASTAGAQDVRIDSHGIRAGGTVIDATGVHGNGTSIDSRGIRRSGGGGGTVIQSNGNTRTVDCGGGALTIDGNRNHVSAARCRAVTLDGNDNVVTLAFAAPGRIAVLGNHNRVTWHAPRTIPVRVTNVGNANQVARR